MSDLNLNGGEIAVLKAIGLGGGTIRGEQLIEKVSDFASAELIDTLLGLMMVGYVLSDKQSLHDIEDVKQTSFHVNSGYRKELMEELDPRRREKDKPSRRVRRE